MATKKSLNKKSLYIEWTVLFKENITQAKKDNGIQALVTYVRKKIKPRTLGASIEYDVFKSEINNFLYILRVYVQTISPGIASARGGTIPPTGPISKPPAQKLARTVSAMNEEGTINPVGPPTRPPSSIESIETN